jgi:hypothetical protein
LKNPILPATPEYFFPEQSQSGRLVLLLQTLPARKTTDIISQKSGIEKHRLGRGRSADRRGGGGMTDPELVRRALEHEKTHSQRSSMIKLLAAKLKSLEKSVGGSHVD